MKIVLKAVELLAAVIVSVLLFNLAIRLMSMPNDFAVVAGIVLGAALFGTWTVYLCHIARDVAIGKFGLCLLVGILALGCSGCYKIVNPGYAGILVKQTGSDRGVQDYPAQSGRVFYNPINEDIFEYPTMVQRAVWTRTKTEGSPENEEFSFQSKEGMHFTADVNCSYELQRDKVPHFYVKFRNNDLSTFTHGFLRDAIRNAFNLTTDYTAEEINGGKQAELVKRVEEEVKKKLEPVGVSIISVGFIAPPRPPEEIAGAIRQKIAAIQRAEQAENEKREAIAQGEKIKALASATADANRTINSSLTPALVQWREMDILQSKWNGQFPQVVGQGGGLLLNLK